MFRHSTLRCFISSRDPDLVVEEVPDLREVAVPLEEVVEHGGLAEEGEVAVEDAPHALLVRRDERRPRRGRLVVALHVPPHLLVLLHLRVPAWEERVRWRDNSGAEIEVNSVKVIYQNFGGLVKWRIASHVHSECTI